MLLIGRLALAACPDWATDPKLVPVCPAQGMLGPEYPALARVLSQHDEDPAEAQRIVEMVRKFLTYSGNRTPLLYLSVPKSTVAAVQKAIAEMDVSAETKQRFLGSIRPLQTKAKWMQDHFQDFVNPENGRPQLRIIEARTESEDIVGLLEEMRADCPLIERGENLRSYQKEEEKRSCEFGGNIECLCRTPLCLRGSNQKPAYARQFCGERHEVAIPAFWLKVGHVDEFVSSYPVPGTKCDVAVAVASYRKAIEVLEASPKTPLFSAVKDKASLKRHFALFCQSLTPPKAEPAPTIPKGGADAHLTEELGGFRTEMRSKPKAPPASDEMDPACAKATVEQFLAYLKKNKDHEHNLSLQKAIYDPVTKDVVDRMKGELGPGCQVKVVELPQIMRNADTGDESYFPNPTNSVFVGDNLLVPDPVSPLLRAATEKAYKDAGLGVSFIESLFLHANQGNLHCATATIPICRGNGKPLPAEPFPLDQPDRVPPKIAMDDPLAWKLFEGGTPEVRDRVVEGIAVHMVQNIPRLTAEEQTRWVNALVAHQKVRPKSGQAMGKILLGLEGEGLRAWNKAYKATSAEGKTAMLKSAQAGSFFDEESAEVLFDATEEALKSKDPALVLAALRLLELPSSAGDRTDALVDLVRPYLDSEDQATHEAAASALSHLDGLRDKSLEKALRSHSPKVRKIGLSVVEYYRYTDSLGGIVPAMVDDEDPEVRVAAYRVLARFDDADLTLFRKTWANRPKEFPSLLNGYFRAGEEEQAMKALTLGLQAESPEDRVKAAKETNYLSNRHAEYFFQNADLEIQRRLLAQKEIGAHLPFAALTSGHDEIVRAALNRAKKEGGILLAVYEESVLKAADKLHLGPAERAELKRLMQPPKE